MRDAKKKVTVQLDERGDVVVINGFAEDHLADEFEAENRLALIQRDDIQFEGSLDNISDPKQALQYYRTLRERLYVCKETYQHRDVDIQLLRRQEEALSDRIAKLDRSMTRMVVLGTGAAANSLITGGAGVITVLLAFGLPAVFPPAAAATPYVASVGFGAMVGSAALLAASAICFVTTAVKALYRIHLDRKLTRVRQRIAGLELERGEASYGAGILNKVCAVFKLKHSVSLKDAHQPDQWYRSAEEKQTWVKSLPKKQYWKFLRSEPLPILRGTGQTTSPQGALTPGASSSK